MLEKVAVTGAGGSLGRALVRRLLTRGFIVKGLIRNMQDASEIERLGGVPVLGDVRNLPTLKPLFHECAVVFHLAAWVPGLGIGGHKTAKEVNVTGTANVIRLAAESGCRRVVHASSIAVYGPKTRGVVTELTSTCAVGDLYSNTKIEGEEIAVATAQKYGIELTILRPTMIYGPQSPSWTLAPFEAIARGLPVILGDGEDLLDAVYVDDVAQAFELAGFNPKAAGEIFVIGNDQVTWNTFMSAYARMAGTNLRRLPIPIARVGMWFASHVSRIIMGQQLIVPEMVEVMTNRTNFSSEKARKVLGYKPAVSLADGMQRTRTWLRQQNKLHFPSTALVTGANGGLGRAIVQGLNNNGLEVWAADLPDTDFDWIPNGVHPLVMDVTSDISVVEAVQIIAQKSDSVDLLINNAGVLIAAPLESQPLTDILIQMEVNALGWLRVAQALAPKMRLRGRGRIVNIGSTNSFAVTPFLGAYSSSKHALKALSEALRIELSSWGIEVVIIHPSSMKTSMPSKAKQDLWHKINSLDEAWSQPLEAFLNSWLWRPELAQSPEQVAEVVVRVAMTNHLYSAEVYVGNAFIVWVFTLLPSFIRDSLIFRMLGLRRYSGH